MTEYFSNKIFPEDLTELLEYFSMSFNEISSLRKQNFDFPDFFISAINCFKELKLKVYVKYETTIKAAMKNPVLLTPTPDKTPQECPSPYPPELENDPMVVLSRQLNTSQFFHILEIIDEANVLQLKPPKENDEEEEEEKKERVRFVAILSI